MEVATVERSATYLDNKANLDNYKDQDEYEKRAKKNHDFVQFTRTGMEALMSINSGLAHKIYYFLCKEMNRENAVIISQGTLSEIFEASRVSINTAIKQLVAAKVLQTIKTGNSVVYCMNAAVVWTQERDKLHLARFNARVIVSKDEQQKLFKDKAPKISLKEDQ